MKIAGFGFGQGIFASQMNQKQNTILQRTDTEKKEESKRSIITDEMRQMLRSMQQTAETNKRAMQQKQMEKIRGTSEKSQEEKLLADAKYNYKDVSAKIQQAKTSTSAGQAVISAKRKVAEIKRKISSGKGDAKELQLALTHAKRMEMVARKKKHHLELEELVEHTRKQDERMDQAKETTQDIRSSMAQLEEENLAKAEDEIFEERGEIMDEAMELAEEAPEAFSEDLEENLAQLNEMISEFGEDELRELEEAMELMETMEVIDPHMSEEDLEELKRKHRNSEMKAMVKADMDYLKEMIKYTMQKGASIPGMPTSGTSPVPAVSSVSATPAVAQIAPMAEPAAVSIDVSL